MTLPSGHAAEPPAAPPATLAQKLVARAAGVAHVTPGTVVMCKVDLAMAHDSSGPRRVAPLLRELGVKVWDPTRFVVVTDHYVPAADPDAEAIVQFTRDWVREAGISNFIDGHGICHVVLPEQGHVLPGRFIVGGDSHTPTGGAFGAYMFGIGATEMFHVFISSAGADVRPGAIGKVVPGYQARVVDDQGREVAHGTIGKLAVKGPTGCRYLADERQRKYVKHGWNYPGDAFMQDADGYFFYKARDDDMIITAGYNVGGPEVEDALLRHPGVAECGVIGAPDDERGMIVKAFCVLREGYTADEAMVKTLQQHVKSSIAPYKYPRAVAFVTSLPRTETGKLQRFRLREL